MYAVGGVVRSVSGIVWGMRGSEWCLGDSVGYEGLSFSGMMWGLGCEG